MMPAANAANRCSTNRRRLTGLASSRSNVPASSGPAIARFPSSVEHSTSRISGIKLYTVACR